MRASVVLCPADFAILACGSLLVLQAPGFTVGVEENLRLSIVSFARVRGLASERLSAVQTKGVLVVEKVSRPSRGSSELGGMSVGVRVVG